jgi:WD40 repeat protein
LPSYDARGPSDWTPPGEHDDRSAQDSPTDKSSASVESFSESASELAAGDRAAIARGNTVEIYELPGGRPLRTIKHAGVVNAVAFAPLGHDLVSGTIDGSLLVTRDGRDQLTLAPASGGIDAAAILPDGRVVAADARGHLRVYDAHGSSTQHIELETPTRVRTSRRVACRSGLR